MRTKSILALLGTLAFSVYGCGGEEPVPQAPPPPPPIEAPPPPPLFVPEPPPPPKPSMAELQHKAMKAIADAYNTHSIDKFGPLFTEDLVIKASGQETTGRDQYVARQQKLLTAVPDLKFAFDHAWSKGNVAVTTWSWTGTDTGGLHDGKPTGRPVGVEGLTIVWFNDDGLVKEAHIYSNRGTLDAQLDPKAKKGSFRPVPTQEMPVETIGSTGSPDEDKLLDAVKPFYVALDEKKEADVLSFGTDDTTIDDYTDPAQVKGKKELKATYGKWVKHFPDFKQLPLTNQWAVQDFVISEGVFTGTNKVGIGGHPPSNKPASIHFVDIVQLKDGKIAHLWTFANDHELMEQIAPKKPAPPVSSAPQAKGGAAPKAAPKK